MCNCEVLKILKKNPSCKGGGKKEFSSILLPATAPNTYDNTKDSEIQHF